MLLIGLGNPGNQYCKTRHNAGFAVIDYLASSNNISLRKKILKPFQFSCFVKNDTLVTLVKPLTYMNRSGKIVPFMLRKLHINVDNLYVICDNIDLPPGMIRLKSGGSSAGHNGIKSIIDNLGNNSFNRMYIGVGKPSKPGKLAEHVLGCFDTYEQLLFDKAVKSAGDALLSIPSKSLNKVMNEINKRNH